MKVKPLSTTTYQSFPLVDGMIEISDSEYEGLKAGTHRFNDDLTAVEKIPALELKAKQLAEEAAKKLAEKAAPYKTRLAEVKSELLSTVSLAVLHAEGIIDDETYAPILEKRAALWSEISGLVSALNILGGETYDVLSIL